MAAAFAAALVAITLIPPRSGVNDTAITLLAVAAGASAPPLGVVMRTLWSTLINDRDVLQTAYSLDGVAEELLYVAGPAITGLAWIEAALSAGSALGGLGYGAVIWRIPARRRLALLAAGLAIILAPAALGPNLPVLALLTGLAGVQSWCPLPWPPPTSSPTAWQRRRHGTAPGTGLNTNASAGCPLSQVSPRCGCLGAGAWSGGAAGHWKRVGHPSENPGGTGSASWASNSGVGGSHVFTS